MKTSVLYGFLLALSVLLVQLVLFIAGLQSDPDNLTTGQWILGLLTLGIAITFLVLAIRARRSQVPATAEFGYGSAFGAGFGAQLFASLFSVGTTYLYAVVINPRLGELMQQAQIKKMEDRGMSSEQIAQFQHLMGFMRSPVAQAIGSFFSTLIFGTIIALIAAAFLKRAGERDPNAL